MDRSSTRRCRTQGLLSLLMCAGLLELAVPEAVVRGAAASVSPDSIDSALLEDRTEPVAAYLRAGGDPDGLIEGTPLLTVASNNGSQRCIRLLLDHGADINRAADDGDTPLMRTARHLYRTGFDPLKLLLDRGAKVDLAMPKGTTALMMACDPPAQHYEDVNLRAVKLLIAHGANVHARNAMGYSPLRLAQERGAKRIVAVLKKAGARK